MTDTSTILGEVNPDWVPEPTDHVYEATNAVHALWVAHQKLCALYEQSYHSSMRDPSTGTLHIRAQGLAPAKASHAALAEICDALLPCGEHLDNERADSVIEALLALLTEMKTQEGQPRSERGCAWPVQPGAATEGAR